MSGGSYDYAYRHTEDLAVEIRGTTPLRKAFKAHLAKVAAACHDIEWVDSCDYNKGDEHAAILACLGTNTPTIVLAVVLEEAKTTLTELTKAIEQAESLQTK